MTENKAEEYEVSDKVLTIPNLLSFIRLCTIPVFLCLLFDDHNLAATILFALAASTDWVDGQVAVAPIRYRVSDSFLIQRLTDFL